MRAHEKTTRDPLPEAIGYVERNRLAWDRWAPDYASAGRKAWSRNDLTWGIWDLPESEVNVLDLLAPGSDVIELGSGTAAISALLARHGMRPVAIDISRAQLATAEYLQVEIGPSFPLIQANAENVPFDTESFDLAISEYGASLWCEPRQWLPEAYRLLRRGGLLLMITNSPLLMACTGNDGSTPTDRLVRDYFISHRLEFPGDGTVEFHLVHGEWIDLLQASGFSLERLIEVRAPHGGRPRLPFVSVDWARLWPSEDIWIVRKS